MLEQCEYTTVKMKTLIANIKQKLKKYNSQNIINTSTTLGLVRATQKIFSVIHSSSNSNVRVR